MTAKDKIKNVIINIFFNDITPIRGAEMITPPIGNYIAFSFVD